MTSSKPRFVTRGLVLRCTDTKESDKILTVLTEELGLVSVIAKGARSRRSKYAAACQNLVYSEMVLSQSSGWYYLVEASTAELFSGLANHIEKLALGAYFAELTEAVCGEGEDTHQMLRLLLNGLYALSYLDKPAVLVKTAFTWRLMEMAGFAPLIDSCAVCGQKPEKPLLDVVQGVVHCAGCKTRGLSLPMSSATLHALEYILTCEDKKLYNFTLKKEPLRLLNHAAEAFVSAQLERSFRTLDYYKSVAVETEAYTTTP